MSDKTSLWQLGADAAKAGLPRQIPASLIPAFGPLIRPSGSVSDAEYEQAKLMSQAQSWYNGWDYIRAGT